MSALLLDTYVWLWLAFGEEDKLRPAARERINQAVFAGKLYLSVISIWEAGMLHSKQRIKLPQPHWAWIKAATTAPGLRLLPLAPPIVLDCHEPQAHSIPTRRTESSSPAPATYPSP